MLQRRFESPPDRVFGRRTAKRVSRRHQKAPFELVEPLSQGHGVVASRTRPPSMASDAEVLSQLLRHGLVAPVEFNKPCERNLTTECKRRLGRGRPDVRRFSNARSLLIQQTLRAPGTFQ